MRSNEAPAPDPEELFAKVAERLGVEALRQAFVAARYEQAAGYDGVTLDDANDEEGLPATARVSISRESCDYVIEGQGYSVPVGKAESFLPPIDEPFNGR
jgi:hypothetical protein